MKLLSRFGLLVAIAAVLVSSASVEAGWRRRIVVVEPAVVVSPVPTVYTTVPTVYTAPMRPWGTSTGEIIQTQYNMIPAEPIGTSAPALPVLAGYEVVTPRKIKVVSPRRVYRYYSY